MMKNISVCNNLSKKQNKFKKKICIGCPMMLRSMCICVTPKSGSHVWLAHGSEQWIPHTVCARPHSVWLQFQSLCHQSEHLQSEMCSLNTTNSDFYSWPGPNDNHSRHEPLGHVTGPNTAGMSMLQPLWGRAAQLSTQLLSVQKQIQFASTLPIS